MVERVSPGLGIVTPGLRVVLDGWCIVLLGPAPGLDVVVDHEFGAQSVLGWCTSRRNGHNLVGWRFGGLEVGILVRGLGL